MLLGCKKDVSYIEYTWNSGGKVELTKILSVNSFGGPENPAESC